MAAASANPGTLVVRIEEIITAPPVLTQFAGREITVQFENRPKLKTGQSAIFYTNGWLFGETIAVRAVASEPVEEPRPVASRARARASARATADPVQNLKLQNLQARLSSADVVVAGKVSAIRLPADEVAKGSGPVASGARRRAAGGAEPMRKRAPITEHDPKWREAVIEVANAEKGAPGRKEVVVRFPSSDDVRWYKAPKFVPGQEGVFILHKTQPPAAARRASRRRGAVTTTEAETTEAFTALDPADFQPIEQKPSIQNLINEVVPTRIR